jgi:hypothetical protein
MNIDYPLRPFIDAPKEVVASLVILGVGACFGQVLFELVQSQFWNPNDTIAISDYIEDALLAVIPTWVMAVLSAVGLVFIVVDFIYLYRALYEGESLLTLFFIAAACQMAMISVVWLVSSRRYPSEFIPFAFVAAFLLGAFYWTITTVKRWTEPARPPNPRKSSAR